MASPWSPPKQTVVTMGGKQFVVSQGKPMSAEEIQDDLILIAELMKGALGGIARHE
jgi:hypothetical protein